MIPNRSLATVGPYEMLYYPTPPETALCERDPRAGFKLLREQIRRKAYTEGLMIGASVVNTYLNNSSQQGVDSLAAVDIEPNVGEGWFRRPRGMRITFSKW